MLAKAIAAGAVGAAIGAAIWAAIAAVTGYEVGYVAWGIGAMVGFCAKVVGGKGTQVGIACAGLAVLAILAGKVIAIRMAGPREVEKFITTTMTRQSYDESVRDAADFAALKSEDDYPQFMIRHQFSEAKTAEAVTASELDKFKRERVGQLQKFEAEHPSFEQWQKRFVDVAVQAFKNNFSITDAIKESFGVMSILFLVLGVLTAYRVGSGGDEA